MDIELLLQDPREDELGRDDGDGGGEGRSALLPVLLARDNHCLGLRRSNREGKKDSMGLCSAFTRAEIQRGFFYAMWYLEGRGHLRKKGASTALEDVLHVHRLWLD